MPSLLLELVTKAPETILNSTSTSVDTTSAFVCPLNGLINTSGA